MIEARTRPDNLGSLIGAVKEFRSALVALLKLYEESSPATPGILPAITPRKGARRTEIAQRTKRVARASGLAANASSVVDIGITVQEVGVLDPITAWQTITRPKPLFTAADVFGACDQAISRLESLSAQVPAQHPPVVGIDALHPTVSDAAGPLWRDGHFRQAVAAAADAVVLMVKKRTGRNDISETALWQETFSDKEPQSGKPRLRWPGSPNDRDVITMNSGLRLFAPGVQMIIRNPAAHQADQLDQQTAWEQLSTVSQLARCVDKCELAQAPPPDGAPL
ncbi:TIGR02391 family protein [Kutzneria buriramensis]|uniref:Uncharacterized protein Ymh n=1 Tax=Kutzneria buriramensis TaxID=1045776 RepID=A0A3E0HLY3_9PSEU|nr:TIGR02391 family protein [Kutzneria buriramensis]REH47045.1 uncharacterized protein Ymh [Kutzneria buriramensis]